jgi:hypothetical protein
MDRVPVTERGDRGRWAGTGGTGQRRGQHEHRGAGQTLTIGVSVDGSVPFPWLQIFSAAGAVNVWHGQNTVFENLAVGSHVFSLWYKTLSDAGTANTNNVVLTVGAL